MSNIKRLEMQLSLVSCRDLKIKDLTNKLLLLCLAKHRKSYNRVLSVSF